MIGRRRHPREAMREVYVPLRLGKVKGRAVWVPLLGPGFRDNLFDAAKVCAQDAAKSFAEISRRARVVRALCEHPELEFFFESMDADMLRDEVRDLEELVRAESANIAHLLDLGDGEVPPQNGQGDGPEPDAGDSAAEEEAWQSADELFAQLLESSLNTVEQVTGDTVSRAGLDEAIARLRELRERGDDGGASPAA